MKREEKKREGKELPKWGEQKSKRRSRNEKRKEREGNWNMWFSFFVHIFNEERTNAVVPVFSFLRSIFLFQGTTNSESVRMLLRNPQFFRWTASHRSDRFSIRSETLRILLHCIDFFSLRFVCKRSSRATTWEILCIQRKESERRMDSDDEKRNRGWSEDRRRESRREEEKRSRSFQRKINWKRV